MENINSMTISKRLKNIFNIRENKKVITAEDKIFLREMLNDTRMIGGRKISCYAYAAQDLCGIEKYTGNDPDVVNLINDWK